MSATRKWRPGRARVELVVEPIDEGRVFERASALMSTGFDVTSEIPLRVRLLRLSPDEHVLVVVVHHICADGFSTGPWLAT